MKHFSIGRSFRHFGVFVVSVLLLTSVVQTANGALALEKVTTWSWMSFTSVNPVARGDVDDDQQAEIITGGYYYDGARNVAQLCVWNGATLALENCKTWYWSGATEINSVAVGDVDGDGKKEIITGGYYIVSYRAAAQLCVWSGDSLTLENVRTWYWIDNTEISSLAIGEVDSDGQSEIITGGYYRNNPNSIAQLCVWNGATLALENVKTWVWTRETYVNSVAVGNVDNDGQIEIVTGGEYYDGYERDAQLCVWNGATMALENVKTWAWGSQTIVDSIAVGDVDQDFKLEIITGGYVSNGAQLCVWSGTSLALKKVQTWRWMSTTFVDSVAVGDVEGDGQAEIVTGGRYNDGARDVAQLCIWNAGSLTSENVQTWYWTSNTYIGTVVVGDVDGDNGIEIVTGGSYFSSGNRLGQLCIWA